jgi:hypothetical protein
MAKNKKPAISGIARPQGFIDDTAEDGALVSKKKYYGYGHKPPYAKKTLDAGAETRPTERDSQIRKSYYGPPRTESMAAAKKQDRADVAAFMKKKKRGRR